MARRFARVIATYRRVAGRVGHLSPDSRTRSSSGRLCSAVVSRFDSGGAAAPRSSKGWRLCGGRSLPGHGAGHDLVAAEELHRMGAQPGDKVAVIGDGASAYWARLAKLRIVAEIMDTNNGAKEFWSAPEELKQNVYQAFAQTHAELLVTSCPLNPSPIPSGWRRLDATPYCIRPLPPSP